VYYRKSKNEKIEVENLENAISRKEAELAEINKHLQALEGIENLKELRKYLKEHGLADDKAPDTPEQLFRQYEYLGFQVWMGRNARNNDLLTMQFARKEDLWLHAKDVSGSHVVIRQQSGQNFPEPVIMKAAALAAYHSKKRNDTVCPVTVTPRKYVRKPKGLPDGAVIVEREKVVLVRPADWGQEMDN
jgi:predicted ribosome quality control (RQC) complex YloA/Tae2 family protein